MFTPKDLIRFVDTLEGQDELLRQYAINVRYCWEIFNYSIYPAVADMFVTSQSIKDALKDAGLWDEVQEVWKLLTEYVANVALEKAGIPVGIRKPLMDFLFPLLYDIIYSLLGPK